ncbi:MAG: STAS domain-containing protein [Bacteroidetes bacterium]|nr:STAS domain-containing protein [Bacteroidota bacterium]
MEGIQTTIKYTGPNDSIGVIKVGGYIDTTTSSELERSLSSLLKKNQYRIIVDLGDVDYISSAGWGIFISEIKGIKENSGDLKLVRMIPEVYEVFELLEFHYILKAYDTIDDAVDAFVKESGGALLSAPRQTPRDTTTQMVMMGKPSSQVAESVEEKEAEPEEEPATAEHDIDDMTVDEKIDHLLSKNSTLSAWQIKKILNSSEYSYTNIGWFEVRKRLKGRKNR